MKSVYVNGSVVSSAGIVVETVKSSTLTRAFDRHTWVDSLTYRERKRLASLVFRVSKHAKVMRQSPIDKTKDGIGIYCVYTRRTQAQRKARLSPWVSAKGQTIGQLVGFALNDWSSKEVSF